MTMDILEVRYKVNKWVSNNFPTHRKYISHSIVLSGEEGHTAELQVKHNGKATALGMLRISNGDTGLVGTDVGSVVEALEKLINNGEADTKSDDLIGNFYEFRFGDGISGATELDDSSVDLLLTDPPYSISKAYTCETQVPRRSRKNGADFIMPKGHFGDWDNEFPAPVEWTEIVLPKVRGWVVVFCAQAQIREYTEIFEAHKLVAIGPMVWHKTNPVPFNHKYKPINAWEAIMVGKRSGTRFNGHAVHNVFTHKSPSPQQRIHPTQKPLSLISEFVDLFSSKGDTVLDPFAGSATTVVAAAGKQRRVIAFESDPEIFDAASKRISNMGMFA